MVQFDTLRRDPRFDPFPPAPRVHGLSAEGPRQLTVSCRLQYEVREEATFLFNVMAARTGDQRIVHESLDISPALRRARWTERDSGNRFVRVAARPGPLAVTYRAVIERVERPLAGRTRPAAGAADDVGRLPKWAYRYMDPSRYCQSDRLADFARRTFDTGPAGVALVGAICDWIADNIDYRFDASDARTSAVDTLIDRAGVCRDFAHLAIAFCRALSIPARFVTGYAWRLEPQDFHAMVEVYCGGRWHLFDPTGRADPRFIARIGTGLDAAQVPFSAFFGDCALTGIDVWCAGQPAGSARVLRTGRRAATIGREHETAAQPQAWRGS